MPTIGTILLICSHAIAAEENLHVSTVTQQTDMRSNASVGIARQASPLFPEQAIHGMQKIKRRVFMKATLSGEALNQLIGAVKAFVSKNNARPQSQFIHILFSADGCKATAYALDGYRAAKESVVCYTVDEDFDVMISAPQIRARRGSTVEVYRDGDYSFIGYGDIAFRTKKPEGEPFNVEKLISVEAAKENKQAFGINADYMIDALRSLKESGASIRKPVVIEFTSPVAPVLLHTDEDNYKVVLPIRIRQ